MKKKSGQIPEKIYLTDLSIKNLEIAKKNFKVNHAEYQRLDLCKEFRYKDNSIDLIISNMALNEISRECLENAIKEIKHK